MRRIVPSKHLGPTIACLMLVGFGPGLNAQSSAGAGSQMRVAHVLGFEHISNNANGNLFIQDHALHFQKRDGPSAQIGIPTIQDVSLGSQDKQVGGLPLALGRAATPYGGGRVIALFSHKKYDTLTLEYLDSDGGLHGAIFQLNKGQGQILRNQLVAEGAHVTEDKTAEKKSAAK